MLCLLRFSINIKNDIKRANDSVSESTQITANTLLLMNRKHEIKRFGKIGYYASYEM